MSKSTTRRLALFTGSSLAVAGVLAAATVGVALAPTAAAAQVVNCTAGVTPLSGPAVVIPSGTHNPGITCVYTGDTALVSTAGNITVSSSGGVPADPLVNGVNLRPAAASDDINWNSSAGTVSGSSQTNGPVIDARTGGDINLTIAGVTGSSNTVTHGIYAVSSGAGDINILNGTASASVTVSATNTTTGDTAIHAQSNGGDIVIGAANRRITANSRLYGIYAQTSGAGGVTIHANAATIGNQSSGSTEAEYAIFAQSGTGDMVVSANSITGGKHGGAVRSIAGGNATLTLGAIDLDLDNADPGRRPDPLIHVTAVNAGTTTTLNLTGFTRARRQTIQRVDYNAIVADGAGSLVVNVDANLHGSMNFAGLDGGADVSLAEGVVWHTEGDSSFTDADDTFTIAEGATFAASNFNITTQILGFGANAGQGRPTEREFTTVQFGAGDDVLTNAGVFAVGYATYVPSTFNDFVTDTLEMDLSLLGLETFNNSGTIIFGLHEGVTGSDGRADDVLIMPGTNFVGSGDSLLMMDVNLNRVQASCDPALRDPDTFDMPAADCISMPGGSTSGVTRILVKDAFPGDRGGYSEAGIVLVDVSGGTGATGDFVLHEDSDGYSPAFGGVIDKGVFLYPLVFDPDTQQHKLVSAPSVNVLQYPLLAQATHAVWRQSTSAWFDRQADARGGFPDTLGGGVWLRVSTEFADRDVGDVIEVAGNPFTYDNGHKQDTYAVTTGVDLMTGDAGAAAFVLGVMGGYAHSKVGFDSTPNRAQFDGYVGGVYGGVVAGNFFLDAAVNANKLIMDHDVPAYGLLPEGTVTSTDLLTYGAQAEAGWRIPFAPNAYVEPLASVSYVEAHFDDLLIVADDASRQGVDVIWDTPKSLRAGLGARLGLEQTYGGHRARYTLLGRLWNEFEDDNSVVLAGQGDPALLVNDFSGQFSEFGFGASLYSLGGAASGFLNFGGKFGDDFKSATGSLGVRVNW